MSSAIHSAPIPRLQGGFVALRGQFPRFSSRALSNPFLQSSIPVTSHQGPSRKRFVIKAEDGNGDVQDSNEPPASTSSEAEPDSPETPPPENAKGQTTAIVTGAISIILGVLYLLLVQFLDSRELQPPPPEAYM